VKNILLEKPKVEFSPYKTALIKLGKREKKVIVIGADLANSCEIDGFQNHFPERFLNVGVAEQNAVDIAVGLSFEGEIPIFHSFGVFVTRRPYEQIAVQVALHKANVKLIGFIPGVTSRLGPTHQAIDDISLMRHLPNMVVIDPGDATEIEQGLNSIVKYNGPVYMRMMRREVIRIFNPKTYKFKIGKSHFIYKGEDITIISCGMMLEEVLKAYDILSKKGLRVGILHVSTIKPLDTKAIINAALTSHILITCENHLIDGGLGSAVAEVLISKLTTRKVILERIGIPDTFGICGEKEFLFKKYGLDASSIANTTMKIYSKYHGKV
jgi:transketolase